MLVQYVFCDIIVSMKISRRQFLFGSASLAALTAAASIVPQLGSYPPIEIHLQFLSNREANIYRTLGNWLIPKGGPLPGSGGDDETLMGIDAMFVDIPSAQRNLLLALPLVFEHGTALNRFASQRLTKLSPEARDAYLLSWTQSDNIIQAQLLAALKTMYAFSYFERLDVLKAMGLDPHCAVQV